MFDTIIIGAGPTGLSAAIYASRRMMKTLIISKNIGGQITWTSEIENYPGIKLIKGANLASEMHEQAKNFGVLFKAEEVKKITRQNNGSFMVLADKEKYIGKTIIIAMGLTTKTLNLPNEKNLVGKGVSYCANCDGLFFKGKVVAVVGGGNAAMDAAQVMSKIASRVYLIYRRSKLMGFEILIAKIKDKSNVEIMLDSEITEILGEQRLEKIKVKNNIDQTVKALAVDGLFIEIGHEPKTDLVADLVKRDSKGQIIADLGGKTSLDGIFAAGDVTQSEFKQIVVGCGQGAVAALSAYKYLQVKN